MGWKPIEGYLIRKSLKGGSPSMDFLKEEVTTQQTVTLETKCFKCFFVKISGYYLSGFYTLDNFFCRGC